jgi:hypothetical protein
LVHIWMATVSWNIRPKNIATMLLVKNLNILIISISENFLKECFFRKKINFTFRCIDVVLSLNIYKICEWLFASDLSQWAWGIPPYTIRSALYVDIHLEIDSEGRLRTKPYDKADDFNLPIMNLPLYVTTFQHYLHMEYIPFSCYNITELVVPFLERGFLLTGKLLRCVFNVNQWFIIVFIVDQCYRCVFLSVHVVHLSNDIYSYILHQRYLYHTL